MATRQSVATSLKPRLQTGFLCCRPFPSLKQVILRMPFGSCPQKKLHVPLAQGLQRRCCAQKAIPPLPSLLPLPVPHADSYRGCEALNISSLIPTEPRAASGWVSRQHSSAPSPLSQGRRMLSISVRSRLAERLQTRLPITRRISQINSRTARQPVGSQGRDRSVLQPREDGQSSSPDAASLLLSSAQALQDLEDVGAADTGGSAGRNICLCTVLPFRLLLLQVGDIFMRLAGFLSSPSTGMPVEHRKVPPP